MKYRKLGNTGLIVSEVALGTMQFGGKMNMGNLGQEDTTRMVKLALDRGINFIDTADVYSLGESETLVGNALKGVRTEIVLATKVRLPMSDNLNRSGATRVNIMREVEASLQRLQTDYIDLYQVHGWDSNTPLEETVRTLDDVVRQGKVRYIGLSNYMSWQAATAVMLQERMGLEKFVAAQMYSASSAEALNMSSSRSPSITTSVSWFGVHLPAASSRVSTAAPTLLLPAHGSRRQVRSCRLTRIWATASWTR
jgi:aryl-alcohol dehydrogenase-like predicted oxidoreductase